jgi:FtsH-binding integral membrane protein
MSIFPVNTEISEEQRNIFRLVYTWMFVGLLISGATSAFVSITPELCQAIVGNSVVFFSLLILELILVFVLAAAMQKLSVGTAIILFILYCFTTGLTFSVIFMVYQMHSIITIFFTTAVVFIIMAVYGYTTDHDLTSWGHVLLFGLLGLVITSGVNLFLNSEAVDWASSVVGVFIFTGLIAYDTQKLKNLDQTGIVEGSPQEFKLAIYGALDLYLDFVNLFLKLLRLFGRRR